MKPIRLTRHAKERCSLRGTTANEVIEAVLYGTQEPAKNNRKLCKYNLPFNKTWDGQQYAIKQVAPVIKEEASEIVVITVYTFYF